MSGSGHRLADWGFTNWVVMNALNTQLVPRRSAAAPSTQFESDISALAPIRSQVQDYRLRRRQSLPSPAGDNVFFVCSGLVAVESTALAGRRTMVELLYPGDIFAASLQPAAASLQCSTMAPTELWRLSSAALKSEMAKDAGIADFVFRRLNQQRARMQLHVSMLAGLTSEERVAALLLQAGCRLGLTANGGISFDMPLSREEVAEYLALNADTLSRIMSRLVREAVLERTSRAQIIIRNWDALKAHCPLADAVIALHTRT
jgi:CRP/FNR family transcriptional regulator